LICGGPFGNPFIAGATFEIDRKGNEVRIPKTLTSFNWLNYIMIILVTKRIVFVQPRDYRDGGYDANGHTYWITPAAWHFNNDFDYGIACHGACYKLLSTKLGYKLKFADVCRLLQKHNNLLKPGSKYGAMAKYQEQFFEYYKVYQKDKYLLYSPLFDKQNQERILKIWKPLIPKLKSRPSPCESATTFKKGTIMYGSDGNKWIVVKKGKAQKWEKMKK